MRQITVLAAVLLVVGAVAYAPVPASCFGPHTGGGGTNCTHRPATIAVHTAAPTFVRSVANGKRYVGGGGNDTFHIAHLYSATDNYYEMGYALGQMFPQEINDMFAHIEPWLIGLLEKADEKLPKWIAKLVVEVGAPAVLDALYLMTKPYIPAAYLDEWRGIAAGANCSMQKIERVSLFPQLSKAACTILVGHKKACANGGVNQLRALDFDPTSHVSDFSSIVIYHFKTKPQVANFGWVAMTGVLTGMNDVPMTVGEKKWGGHNTLVPDGLPWEQLVRKTLELGNLSAVNEYIRKHDFAANKSDMDVNTVSIHLGYGDGKANEVIGYEIGYNFSKSFAWNTHRPSRTHPLFQDIVYWSKNDPARTMCPADMLKAQYGQINGEWMAMYYSPNDKTGDTQVVGFDLDQMKVWYANSRKSTADPNTPLCAYYRQRTEVDMKALFAEPKP
jgi:hypothetical protein